MPEREGFRTSQTEGRGFGWPRARQAALGLFAAYSCPCMNPPEWMLGARCSPRWAEVRVALATSLAATMLLLSARCSLPGPGSLTVFNVNDPTVNVYPWQGSKPYSLQCGHTIHIRTDGAPQLPWTIRVTTIDSGRQIAQAILDSPSDDTLIIRTSGIVIAASPPSYGPYSPCP